MNTHNAEYTHTGLCAPPHTTTETCFSAHTLSCKRLGCYSNISGEIHSTSCLASALLE